MHCNYNKDVAFRLLVCDDDDGTREVIKSTLKKKGFEVLEAKNVKEAVELCSKHSFDCILMDIEMPVMDGIEATKRILEINPKAVVIGITGHCNRAKDLQLVQAKEVLPKPFSTKELLIIIEKHTKNEKNVSDVQVLKNLDFAKILDGALVECYIFDEDGKIVYVNDIVSAFTGYSKDELAGMNAFNLVYEEDIQKAKEARNRSSLGKNVFYEVRYRTKGAKIRWAWGFNKPIELNGKRYFLGYLIDVTRQKRLEEKLKENEEFFKNLIEDSLAAVYIANESRFLYVNKAVKEITGYKKEELLSMYPLQQLVHPEDRMMVLKSLGKDSPGLDFQKFIALEL
jgi:two-component system chemotaxis response regulator CheY